MGITKANKPLAPFFRRPPFPLKMLLIVLSLTAGNAQSADVNTSLPALPADKTITTFNVNLPRQPLDVSLKQLARQTGLSLAFDSRMASGKTAPELKGVMHRGEALRRLLMGTDLAATINGDNAVIQRRSLGVQDDSVRTQTIDVRAQRYHEIGPMPGLALTKEQIPGNVQSISAEEIKESHSLSITDLMNRKLQSVMVNDYQGNPFQMDVQYRGFTASPQLGTPQGLSVFLDGIRVNEPFGDVVNWDLIPMNALAGLDVFPGSNPVFGLGTLGGAIAMRTKDGFSYPGLDAEVLAGSFGRKQLQVSGGVNNASTDEEGSWDNGNFALYGAGSFFLEDGWRDNSPSRVNQVFGKASYRGEKLDLSLNTLLVKTDLVGNGLIPNEMYAQDHRSVFSSPDSTDNSLVQFQLSSSYFVNDNFSITAQAYKRKSRRHQINGDVYTEHDDWKLKRDLAPGEEYTCLYNSTNDYGLPDYYVVSIPGGEFWDMGNWPTELQNFAFAATLEDAFAALPPGAKNAALPPEMAAIAKKNFETQKNVLLEAYFQSGNNPGGGQWYEGPVTDWSNGNPSYKYEPGWDNAFPNMSNSDPFSTAILGSLSFYYYTGTNAADSTLNILLVEPASNADRCLARLPSWAGSDLTMTDDQGRPLTADGGAVPALMRPGVVDGTPTAVITDTRIDQETDGASIQFNWNFEKHKFMVGASIDAPSATYGSGQRFGMLDANRHAFLAPDLIRDQYAAADYEIRNNDFEGSQITRSIYASETWSPVDTLHITGAMRYNETRGKNEVASRTWGAQWRELHTIENYPDFYDICRPGEDCETGYGIPPTHRLMNKPETEKFSYYSLNPSLGVSWQAKPTLNIFGNVARGTRTPSVIELGCAFDDTPYGPSGLPKSLVENRSCSLPTTLSGDPYLPQIKATSFDLGMRGQWGENTAWNLGVYRTNLKDDIYMIGFPGGWNYFDTVGKTRRQGLEAGISGAFGKWDVSLNYSLTEATFQDTFIMPADDNSSSMEGFWGNHEFSRVIEVKPGNRMPGVPLHNLNATVAYSVTPKWKVGMSAVAHSFSYVRGNENNRHRAGEIIYESIENPNPGPGQPQFVQYARRRTNNPGTVDGFKVFNFLTSYQMAPEWTLSLQVNNVFDKEYFTAGRLGINPFAPSVNGAVSASGYNHNSLDWINTNFLAPGAPRAAWLSLRYEFDPRR
jgi:outer membrane receptor protein involved in Fe transport